MNANLRTVRRCVLIFSLLWIAASLGALDLTVEYVDGFLDVRDGNEWLEVFLGDVIADNDVIRLDEDSIAELYGPGIKLTLTKPGVYEVSQLIAQTGEQRTAGLASMVGGKVASLFSEHRTEAQTAVMGVRGAKSESTVQWMTGDTSELLGAAKERLEANNLDEAFELLSEAYDFAEMDEETEVLFYLGYTAYLMGNLRVSADYLGEITDVDTEAEFFPNLFLLNGQILTETFANQDAIDWINAYKDSVTDSVRQTALLIEGVNYKALGEIEDAKQAFDQASMIDPSTDVAKTAVSLKNELE